MKEEELKEKKALAKISSAAGKVKKLFSLDVEPNEQEAKILLIVERAVREEGTVITYTGMHNAIYLRNVDKHYIVKIEDTAFTLVQLEADKILLNVHLPNVIANKVWAVVDRKRDEIVEEIEKVIEAESDKTLDGFSTLLAERQNIRREGKDDVGE